MKVSKLIDELQKVKSEIGDCNVVLHDSATGDTMTAFDVCTDVCTHINPLCIIGVDSSHDVSSLNHTIKVDTPLGPIVAQSSHDKESPGIWLLGGKSDGNAVLEYDSYWHALILRVWDKRDMNGDPTAITVVSESPMTERQLRKLYGSEYLE